MVALIERNRAEKITDIENMTLFGYIHSKLKAFKLIGKSVGGPAKQRKFLSRTIKHYYHSKQLSEFKNKHKTVYYVYGIKDKKYPDYIKIGITTSVEARLSQYRICSPFPDDFYILSYRPTLKGFHAERVLHSHFGEHRVNGEWFKITDVEFMDVIEQKFQIEFQIDNLIHRFFNKK